MDRYELHQKLLKSDTNRLKIKFKNYFTTGRFSTPHIESVSPNEIAFLTDVQYDQRVFYNYPQGVTVIDVLVTRLSKRQRLRIEHGEAFIPVEYMEEVFPVEIVLPEEIDFDDVLKIIEED